MQCANREGNGDPLAFELVPDIRAHGVVDFIDSGVIAHVELDLVDHSGIGKIDQKHLDRRFCQDAVAVDAARNSASFTRFGGFLYSTPTRIRIAWTSVG